MPWSPRRHPRVGADDIGVLAAARGCGRRARQARRSASDRFGSNAAPCSASSVRLQDARGPLRGGRALAVERCARGDPPSSVRVTRPSRPARTCAAPPRTWNDSFCIAPSRPSAARALRVRVHGGGESRLEHGGGRRPRQVPATAAAVRQRRRRRERTRARAREVRAEQRASLATAASASRTRRRRAARAAAAAAGPSARPSSSRLSSPLRRARRRRRRRRRRQAARPAVSASSSSAAGRVRHQQALDARPELQNHLAVIQAHERRRLGVRRRRARAGSRACASRYFASSGRFTSPSPDPDVSSPPCRRRARAAGARARTRRSRRGARQSSTTRCPRSFRLSSSSTLVMPSSRQRRPRLPRRRPARLLPAASRTRAWARSQPPAPASSSIVHREHLRAELFPVRYLEVNAEGSMRPSRATA